MTRRIWILSGGRVGDLKQMQVLAANLGWPVIVKNLVFTNQFLSSFPFLAPRLLNKTAKRTLSDPLPDLIICAGSRTAAVALSLKQYRKSRVKIVCLARPKGNYASFDLIITTPQFDLPKASNILKLNLPLTEKNLSVNPRLTTLPRPHTVVLVGGASSPYVLDENVARLLAERIDSYVRGTNGTLLLATSLRTGVDVDKVFVELLTVPRECFFWSAQPAQQGNNPYRDYLAVADEIIVTADSVSMAADAIATGKPVFVYDLPQRWRPSHKLVNYLASRVYVENPPFWAPLVRKFFDWGIVETRANRAELFRKLSEAGKVSFFGQSAPAMSYPNDTEDIDVAVQRVRELFPS